MSSSSPPVPLPASIRLVVLDLAGTILDDRVEGVPVVAAAMTAAFAREGIRLPPEAIRAQRGRRKADAVRRLVAEIGDRSRDAQAVADHIYAAFIQELEQRLPALSEIPGTSTALRLLQSRGIRVAIESGFPAGVVLPLVHRLGWERAGLVDYVVPDEMGAPRPEPAGILAAMRRLEIADPRMVTKAADTVLDVEEGRNAGVWIVGVLTGGGSREELEAAGADRVVESVRDLPALLHLRVQAAKLDPLKGASSPAHSR